MCYDMDAIPDSMWRIILPQGAYLKEMMLYCAYDTKTAASKLNDPDELKEMFKLAIGQADHLSDEDRKKIFGKFDKNPQDVKILPGLVDRFRKFVQMAGGKPPAEKTQPPKRKSQDVQGAKGGPEKVKKTVIAVKQNAADVRGRMEKWLKKNVEEEITFEIASNSSSTLSYKCLTCQWKTDIPADSKGCYSLSNANKHYRPAGISKVSSPCQSMRKKKVEYKAGSSSITGYLKKTNSPRQQSSNTNTNTIQFDRQVKSPISSTWISDGQTNTDNESSAKPTQDIPNKSSNTISIEDIHEEVKMVGNENIANPSNDSSKVSTNPEPESSSKSSPSKNGEMPVGGI